MALQFIKRKKKRKMIRPSYSEIGESNKWTEQNTSKTHKSCITSHITVAKFVAKHNHDMT